MPGLSQLKKFNKDILSLGDEITLRSARGEQPIKFPIPKDVEDKNDSEDFVLGMPEKPAAVEVEVLDEDFSDITGIVPESKNDEAPTVSFEAPDMSSLLNPIQDFSEDSEFGMPDLSAFMEEEIPQPEVESEPEEISIADMDLDALLAGEGFDGSEGFGEQSAEPNSVIQGKQAKELYEKAGFTTVTLTASDITTISTVVTSACDQADVIYIPTDNLFAENMESVKNITEPAKIPVICGEGGMVQSGGTASVGIDYYVLGYRAGEMAYEILVNGAKPATTPIGFMTAEDMELVINEANVAAIGLTIPEDLK